MKVYNVPKETPVPKVDYGNFDLTQVRADENAHQLRVRTWLLAHGWPGKRTGEIMSLPVADGAALYMYGDGVTPCLIHLPYGDGYQYVGVERFTKADVLKHLDSGKALAKLFARTDDFWKSRKPGEIVHYDNGGNAFVRGVIVETPKGMAMQPIALVGAWSAHDLPHWDSIGEIDYGYHGKQIRTGETMTPNDGNMYEANPSRFKVDPRALPELSLVPRHYRRSG